MIVNKYSRVYGITELSSQLRLFYVSQQLRSRGIRHNYLLAGKFVPEDAEPRNIEGEFPAG